MNIRIRTALVGGIAVLLTTALSARQKSSDPKELIGTWRGTSTCTDRVALPACTDEEVVYDFTAGDKPGVLHWNADKIVAGKREGMGAFDLTYDTAEACWKAQFDSTRATSVWRVVANGDHLTGTAQQLPGKQIIRRIDARRVR